MTIAIKHADSGEIQFVDSIVGYGEDWAQIGPALPADADPARILLVDGAWVTDLAVFRQERWAAARAARERAQLGGCVTPLGRVDTDAVSQLKVTGAVQMAMLALAAGQPFSLDWTMQDNSTVTHDAAAMIAMGMAVGQHIAACHEHALTKRAAIEAASDAAALNLVEVDDGWPD